MASNPWMERQKEPSVWPEGSFLYFFPIFLLNSIIHLEIGIFFLSWRTFSRFCPHPPKKPQVFGGMNFFDKFRARHRHHNLPSIVYYLLSFVPVYLPQRAVIQSPLLHAELRRRLGRRRLQGHPAPAQLPLYPQDTMVNAEQRCSRDCHCSSLLFSALIKHSDVKQPGKGRVCLV